MECALIFKSVLFIFDSGYDFGYLLKILTNTQMPAEEADFFDFLRIYFPNIYDVKYLMKSCKNLKGGLQEVAEQLEVINTVFNTHTELHISPTFQTLCNIEQDLTSVTVFSTVNCLRLSPCIQIDGVKLFTGGCCSVDH